MRVMPGMDASRISEQRVAGGRACGDGSNEHPYSDGRQRPNEPSNHMNTPYRNRREGLSNGQQLNVDRHRGRCQTSDRNATRNLLPTVWGGGAQRRRDKSPPHRVGRWREAPEGVPSIPKGQSSPPPGGGGGRGAGGGPKHPEGQTSSPPCGEVARSAGGGPKHPEGQISSPPCGEVARSAAGGPKHPEGQISSPRCGEVPRSAGAGPKQRRQNA